MYIVYLYIYRLQKCPSTLKYCCVPNNNVFNYAKPIIIGLKSKLHWVVVVAQKNGFNMNKRNSSSDSICRNGLVAFHRCDRLKFMREKI